MRKRAFARRHIGERNCSWRNVPPSLLLNHSNCLQVAAAKPIHERSARAGWQIELKFPFRTTSGQQCRRWRSFVGRQCVCVCVCVFVVLELSLCATNKRLDFVSLDYIVAKYSNDKMRGCRCETYTHTLGKSNRLKLVLVCAYVACCTARLRKHVEFTFCRNVTKCFVSLTNSSKLPLSRTKTLEGRGPLATFALKRPLELLQLLFSFQVEKLLQLEMRQKK